MLNLKTFEAFQLEEQTNEKAGEVIGHIRHEGINDIEIKDGENFVTITQLSAMDSSKKNVIVLPHDSIKEFIRDLNGLHGYFTETE